MANTKIYKSNNGKKQVISFYENLLEQWHQPYKQLTIETTFGKTFIIESGVAEAQTVPLLHGSSSNIGMWATDVKELSKSYHVFAIDIIGECGKSSENRPPFKDGNYSNWVYEITEKLEQIFSLFYQMNHYKK
jgi:pimeloyl-ACP methyl ester carboxylesterase